MGTIRGDYGVDVGRNLVHASDSLDSAEREKGIWFPEGVWDWRASQAGMVYEDEEEEDEKEKAGGEEKEASLLLTFRSHENCCWQDGTKK